MIELSDLQRALEGAPANSTQALIIQELMAMRQVADAAIIRHEAQFSHDFAAYSRANDLLLERCDEYQRTQRF